MKEEARRLATGVPEEEAIRQRRLAHVTLVVDYARAEAKKVRLESIMANAKMSITNIERELEELGVDIDAVREQSRNFKVSQDLRDILDDKPHPHAVIEERIEGQRDPKDQVAATVFGILTSLALYYIFCSL